MNDNYAEYSIFDNMDEGMLIANNKFEYIYSNKKADNILSDYISETGTYDNKKLEELFLCEGNFIIYKDKKYELRISKVQNNKVDGYIAWLFDVTDYLELNKEIAGLKAIADRATRAKDEFLANMSHEIRTPMNAIYGMAEMLSESNLPPLEKDYVNTIKTASINLLNIINDILDFSKIESGKIEVMEEDYELRNVIEEVCSIISSRAAEAKLKFIVNVEPDIPIKLNGDDKKIKQILINLLNNAVKFTEKGQIVLDITGKVQDDYVQLCFKIKDSGIGIKKEDFHKIFMKFEQADTKKNRHIEGTGLGLPLSKKLSMLMGGDITVESEYGKGSCFSVFIKQKIASNERLFDGIDINSYNFIVCESDDDYRKSIIKTLESLNANYTEFTDKNIQTDDKCENIIFYEYNGINLKFGNNTKTVAMINFFDHVKEPDEDIIYVKRPINIFSIEEILNGGNKGRQEKVINFIAPDAKVAVVDDNEVNLKVAQGLMSKFKIKPELFTSGYDIVNRLKNKINYDIIFMDHMMSGMDGIEATQSIRKMSDESISNVIIIALTANAIKGTEKQFRNAGMNDVLYKPIMLIELRNILEKYLPEDKKLYTEHIDIDDGAGDVLNKELPKIEGINIENALKFISGNLADYEEILYKFYRTIDKKKEAIEQYFKDDDIKNYTIEVHGLKSASKFVGAEELSDFAAYLEQCGNEKNICEIKNKTEKLLSMLQRYKYNISLYIEEKEKKLILREDSDDDVLSILMELKEALEDFNITEADKKIRELKKYKMDYKKVKLLKELESAMDEVNFEKCLSITEEMKLNYN